AQSQGSVACPGRRTSSASSRRVRGAWEQGRTEIVRRLPERSQLMERYQLDGQIAIRGGRAEGIAPASPETQPSSLSCLYGKSGCFWREAGWKPAAPGGSSGHSVTLPPELQRVIEAWPSLPRHVIRAILALVE